MCDFKYGIIFKSSDDSECDKDPFQEVFEQVGIKCQVISSLDFEFIHLDELKEKLNHSDLYSGIVFTSPRSIKAVKLSNVDVSKWKNHRIFVVGEKTKKSVIIELGLNCEGDHCGNSNALAEYILKENITKQLLLPVGNLSRDVLPKMLMESGICLDQIIVYNTVPNPNIECNILAAFKQQKIDYVTYFSPSAVDITFPLFSKNGILTNNIQWFAIGPTTKKALLERGVHVSIVPDFPTPDSFAAALNHIF